MGCCCAITKDFLQILETKHKISSLASIINSHFKTIAFERVLSVLVTVNYPDIKNDSSYEGEIADMVWGYSYNCLITNKKQILNQANKLINIDDKAIIKLFFARN
jgi:hypothetical protein